jgi:hypothetical protein
MGQLTNTTAQVQAILNGQYTYADGSFADKQILRITNSNAAKGPFCLTVSDHVFGAINDYWMMFGYNIGYDGYPVVATEPLLGWTLESSYYNGVDETVEYYLSWISPVGMPWARLIDYNMIKSTGIMSTAAMTFPRMYFRVFEAAQRVFADLGACSFVTNAVTFPEFSLKPLVDQTGDSLISITAGNARDAVMTISSATRTGSWRTYNNGIYFYESTGGDIQFNVVGHSSCLGIKADGNVSIANRIVQVEVSGALTDGAPTDAEIDTATGTTAGACNNGWQCTLKDNAGSGLLYRIESDGINWFYTVMTKAV